MSGLLSLPSHLLIQVASHLPRSDAISLARTCSSLREIGETAIWNDLNMSINFTTYSERLNLWNKIGLLGGSRLRTIRGLYDFGPHVHPTERFLCQSRGLGNYLASLTQHLQARPSRLKSVRKLQFDLDRLVPGELVSLLHLISPTLVSLELVAPDSLYNPFPDQGFYSLEQALKQLKHPFSVLQHLELPLNRKWEERIRRLLRLTPCLTTLRLVPSVLFSGGWGERSSFPVANRSDQWPTLPRLRRLEVEQMSENLGPMILSLAQSSKILRKVALRDPELDWRPKRDDPLPNHLSKANLEYLTITAWCLPLIEASEGFCGLRMLAVEEEVDRPLSSRLNNLIVPSIPSIERLYLYKPPTSEDIATWAWGGDWLSLPEPIAPIPPTTLQALLAAPNLQLVQFPGVPWKEHITDDWEYWASPKCYSEYNDAILIRTYTPRTTNEDKGEKEVLVHCRSYAASYMHETKGKLYRAKNVWEEYTDYAGHCVPADILSRIYTISGVRGDWVQPGRNLELAEEAWEVLKEWKLGQEERIVEMQEEEDVEQGIDIDQSDQAIDIDEDNSSDDSTLSLEEEFEGASY